jgi:hypothetical protein
MRFKMMILALVIVGISASARAQSTTQTQWILVTTSETQPNAFPVSVELNGTSINCSGTNPDNQGAQDVGKVGPVGDCYNPLIVTFNLTVPLAKRSNGEYCRSSDSWNAAASSLPGNGFTDISRTTNSIDSPSDLMPPSPDVTSINVDCFGGYYIVTVTNADTSIFTFYMNGGSDPISGIFASTGGSSKRDSGAALAYEGVVLPASTYTGTFDNNFAADGVTPENTNSTATIAFGTPTLSSDFAYTSAVTLTETSGNVCFFANHKTLTSTDPSALASGPNYVTGDFSVINVGDGTGTVVTLFFSPGSGPNGEFGDGANPDSNTSEFVTYVVSSTGGSVPSSCSYTSGYDAPFRHASPFARIWGGRLNNNPRRFGAARSFGVRQ